MHAVVVAPLPMVMQAALVLAVQAVQHMPVTAVVVLASPMMTSVAAVSVWVSPVPGFQRVADLLPGGCAHRVPLVGVVPTRPVVVRRVATGVR